jgi:hypothetical protein
MSSDRGANTLVYCDMKIITAVKRFRVKALVAISIKLFFFVTWRADK